MTINFSFNTFNGSTYYGSPPSLPAQIRAAAAAGYDFVGLDVPSIRAHDEAGTSPAAIRDVLDQCRISCYEIVPLSLSSNPDVVAESLALVCRFAPAIGAQHVLATVRSLPDAALAENLRRASGTLGEAGVRMSLEFMPSSPLPSISAALDLIDQASVPEVAVVLDVWHFALGACEWPLLETVPLSRIGFIQLDDALATADGRSHHDCMEERLMPGDGELPLTQILQPLLRRGYDGVVSVEVLSSAWRTRSLDDFASTTLSTSRAVIESCLPSA